MDPMDLSPLAVDLAAKTATLLRLEYADHCRARKPIETILETLQQKSELLPCEEARLIMRIVRPLEGYKNLSVGERQFRLVKVGRELARISKTEKGRPNAASSPNKSTKQTLAKTKSAFSTANNPKTVTPPPAGSTSLTLNAPLTALYHVGSVCAKLLCNLGLFKIGDLLSFYPKRWEDRTNTTPIEAVSHQAYETVIGELGPFSQIKSPKGMTIVKSSICDGTGVINLTWFNQPFITKKFREGFKVAAYGKVEINLFEKKMSAPEIERLQDAFYFTGRIVPTYRLTSKLSQNFVRKLLYSAIPTFAPLAVDSVPKRLVKKRDLMPKKEAVLQYHWPNSHTYREKAESRLAYEELLLMQIQIADVRLKVEAEVRRHFYENIPEYTEEFLQLMPFKPTGAQKRVFDEISKDLQRSFPMNRLLQGDVGSGKTMVAAFAAFIAVKNNYQAAIMAPTEILAEQHYQKLKELLEPKGIVVGRLQGNMTKKKKAQTCDLLATHQIDLIVGTHALIQESVVFANLGLVVVDEQHKFGVMQRTLLKQKASNGISPDLMVMTATPIPRTLSLTLFGDLDVSRIDELPPGRKPIRSEYVPFSQRDAVYELIRGEINKGRQAYIICPLIDESDKISAKAAIQEAESLKTGDFKEYQVGLLHGKMKNAEKDQVMEDFRKGFYNLLISTTVIEVGVDVPNATVMLVQDADRFGLAQLHQLRGRIGRGQHASTCIFMGQANKQDSKRKLKAIASLSDGFEVAEEDLEIRGPGDYYGTRQSGLPELKVADLLRDSMILMQAKEDAEEILHDDPNLLFPDNKMLKSYLMECKTKAAEIMH